MDHSTINPPPPILDDLVWRPVGHADISALVDLAKTCFLSDGGLHFLFEPDEIISRFFPDQAWVAAGAFDRRGELVACSSVSRPGSPNKGRAIIVGQVRPDLRRRGIGAYLMRWSLAQAEALLAGEASHQVVIQIRTESLTEPASRLYIAHGFQHVDEDLVMRRDLILPLPDRALPPEVTITTWQPELAGLFFQAYDAAFRERPGFPGYNAVEWVERWMDAPFKPEWSLLACADGAPLAFLLATSNPPHGFVMQVGVIPSQRRRGLCSWLIVETMRRMLADGAVSAQLNVYTNNPGAIQAYAGLGFVTIGRRARYEKTIEM